MGDTNSLTEQGKAKPVFVGFRERESVLLLCLAAAIHVFIFSAAFPFFTNIDEPMHFDLVVKYSHGDVPRSLEPVSPDSSVYLALFSSCVYFGTPDKFPGGRMPPPPWTQPPEQMQHDLAVNSAGWAAQKNYEASQAPLYYTVAGLWWHLGQWCGFKDGRLLYWLRFLNILVVTALVWAGYMAARMIFPESHFLRLGVPALLAFLPQSAFYSIENDVLSPLCFGVAFICLIKLLAMETPNVRLGMVAGLALGMTFLTKAVNLPLLAVSVAVVLFKMLRLAKSRKLRAALPALATWALCMGIPVGCWMAWCEFNFGDPTGASANLSYWGVTHKPFADWWHHPIFTPLGLWTYVSGLLETFWQGEFWWHNQPMTSPVVGLIYALLSLCLVSLALFPLILKTTNASSMDRRGLWYAFWCFAAGMVFFGFLSIIYDFNNSPNPSREHPYFTLGRLMLGALIPFILLFAYGLDRALNRLGDRAKFLALGAMILFMLISEISTDWPAFSNEYNWFHL